MALMMFYLCAACFVTCLVCANGNKLDVVNFAVLHNDARKEQESLQPIAWDEDLAKAAQELVDVCVWKQMYFRSKRMATYIGDATQSGTPSHAMDSWIKQKKFVTNGRNGACCGITNHTCCEYNKLMSDKVKSVGCGHKVCEQLTMSTGTLTNAYSVICLYKADSSAAKKRQIRKRSYEVSENNNGCSCCSFSRDPVCCDMCTRYVNRFQTTPVRVYRCPNGYYSENC